MTIQPGDMIGVFAPSSYVDASDMELSEGVMRQHGYEIFIHPQSYERYGQMAGTPQQKTDALHDLYQNPDIKAIWAAGGGNRAMQLLELLDYDLIRAKPKPFIGYSDVTALLAAIYKHTSQTGIHGPVFKELHKTPQLDQTIALLADEKPIIDGTSLKSGQASGPLIGGCLSIFHLLVGTQDCPDLNGTILFLEDSSDHLSRFDRMFIHMKRMGVFDQIDGLVLGEFLDLKEGTRPFGLTIEEIVSEMIGDRDIPILINAPFGHGQNNTALPYGAEASLTVGEQSSLIF